MLSMNIVLLDFVACALTKSYRVSVPNLYADIRGYVSNRLFAGLLEASGGS